MFNVMNFVVFMGAVSSIEKHLFVNGLTAHSLFPTNASSINFVFDKISDFLIDIVFPLMDKQAPPNHRYKDTMEFIANMGFTAEKHYITTSDGYVIEIHRIKSLDDSISSNYPPIFLQHGLFDTSSNWVMNSCNQSLGHILSSAGFDVWLSNVRGNIYGRQHRNPRLKSTEFWDYSLDEMAQRDLAAAIDYVLKVTNRTQVNYIGHSMGTTLAFILLATQPQYNQKIKTVYAIAPVAYIQHLKSPLARAVIFFYGPQATFWSTLGSNEIFLSDHSRRLLKILCHLNVQLCAEFIGQFVGPNLKEIDMMYNSNSFRQFDLGIVGNLLAYHQVTPPEYNLKNINTSTVFICGLNDYVSDIEDVKLLSQRLPHHTETIIVDDQEWNHMDFMTSSRARKVIYQLLVDKLLSGKENETLETVPDYPLGQKGRGLGASTF